MRLDLTGAVFGRLTIDSYFGLSKDKRTLWNCSCSCGNKKVASRHELRSGDTKSCGCLRIEMTRARSSTHGKRGCNEYKIWLSMKDRCLNKNANNYNNYGGRGISVCDEWGKSFSAFYADMGRRPSLSHSIDRIDNNGNYTKNNCKWATRREQNNNRRETIFVEYGGARLCLSSMCEKTGINYHCAQQRLHKYKWSVFDTFSKPVGIARNFKK